jgi:hypothetical protein
MAPPNVSIPQWEALPSFSKELEALPVKENEPGLASRVLQLVITHRKSHKSHRRNEVGPGHGMIIVDVLGETIAQVEVLYRDEIRAALVAVLP